ncbi:MAG: aldo/keto reductase [Micrococcales bacterium]|nr:aldo/keto reductase [Micrococcales bacterium]
MSVLSEHFVMSNGVSIPKLGLGTWQTPQDVAPGAVEMALAAGYTHIDTARAYRNEAGVARGLRASGMPREQVFVTSKVAAEYKSYDEAKASIATSLRELDTYIDLLLIHAPRPWSEMFSGADKRYFAENRQVWQAMEEAYRRGDVKAIGVSNFAIDDLTNITDHCEVVPVANQINFHIGHTQDEVTAYCQANGILVEAYSPIATGALLGNKDILSVAKEYGVSVAQVCIRYTLQKGCVSLPKSTHREYILQNAAVDFEISAQHMAALDALDVGDVD